MIREEERPDPTHPPPTGAPRSRSMMLSDTERGALGEFDRALVFMTGGSESCRERGDGKDPRGRAIAPHLSRVMQRGTAQQVAPAGECEDPCMSIVAQAQREDLQEFSPSNTRCSYSHPRHLLQNKRSVPQELLCRSDTEEEDGAVKLLRRPPFRRTGVPRRSPQGGEHPPVIRGLWVKEIDWLKSSSFPDIIPPPPQFTDSPPPPRADLPDLKSTKCSRPDDSGGSDSDWGSRNSPDTQSDSSCSVDDDDFENLYEFERSAAGPGLDLMQVSGFDPSSPTGQDCEQDAAPGQSESGIVRSGEDSSQSALEDELRGRVTHTSKLLIADFIKELPRLLQGDTRSCDAANEGVLFHHRLQTRFCRYRAGEEYSVLHHIQNGSYGDVFCVRDKSTNFRCAAKRIPLSHFSSQEAISWSRLSSPRVVELFGVVREGSNLMMFMDLKHACLAQLLKETDGLPEDLALHYLHQTLEALEHLHHRRVLHLDVKADNVLLSANCRDTFLCDFGLAQTLNPAGWSTKAVGGSAFPGTETHMAPEVARGDRLCAKADVWSSCCMLLHMLNGSQPWLRYYSHPLCLQIVNEPPPLWEVPSTCNNFTAKVFRAGLQKDVDRRATAKELKRKTTKALRAVGGLSPSSVQSACEKLRHIQKLHKDVVCSPSLTPNKPPSTPHPAVLWVSPWRTLAVDEDSEDDSSDPNSDADVCPLSETWSVHSETLHDNTRAEVEWDAGSGSDIDIYMGEEEFEEEKWRKDQDYEGDWEEEEEQQQEEKDDDEEDWDSTAVSTEYLCALKGLFPLLRRGQLTRRGSWGSEGELEYLRDDVPVGTVIRTPSPEPRDLPPSCFSCSDSSVIDALDTDSEHSSDDLSSGVFSSCNTHPGRHLEWRPPDHQRSTCCFEGVDIWIENMQGECLRIRENRRVKVGHVAIGISDQISGKAFTLETLDRKAVSFEEEIKESGLWLRCVPASDGCRRWKWRVKDGKLELRE